MAFDTLSELIDRLEGGFDQAVRAAGYEWVVFLHSRPTEPDEAYVRLYDELEDYWSSDTDQGDNLPLDPEEFGLSEFPVELLDRTVGNIFSARGNGSEFDKVIVAVTTTSAAQQAIIGHTIQAFDEYGELAGEAQFDEKGVALLTLTKHILSYSLV